MVQFNISSKYYIKDNNYFKLRDVAYALKGTEKQFEVVWNAEKTAIELYSNKSYTPVGGELSEGDGKGTVALSYTDDLFKDGIMPQLTAYTIYENNYVKLRDLEEAFDFNVTWDDGDKAILMDATRGYTTE